MSTRSIRLSDTLVRLFCDDGNFVPCCTCRRILNDTRFGLEVVTLISLPLVIAILTGIPKRQRETANSTEPGRLVRETLEEHDG